jgi:uncharacterized membrane protein
MNEHYKWGFIYFNPKDKRTVVRKSNPYLGFTLNFGQPLAYVLLICILGIIIYFSLVL